MTYNHHPHEKIRRYENNQTVEKFDDYDTLDSRGLLYEEESLKQVPIVREEKKGFTHYPMPMYLFQDNKAFSGKVEPKETVKAHKQAVNDETIQPLYIYQNKKKVDPIPVIIPQGKSRPVKEKDVWTHSPIPMYMYHDEKVYQNKFKPNDQKEPGKYPLKTERDDVPVYIYKPVEEKVFVEPESSKKIIPVVVAKVESPKKKIEEIKEYANDNVKPDKMNDTPIIIKQMSSVPCKKMIDDYLDMPSARLPLAPNLEKTFMQTETKEDVSPVILIPATLKEDSPKKEIKKTHNPNLMNSYREETKKIEKSRLTKLDDFDNQDDMFVPMNPHVYKKDQDECLCNMCIKNKSRIKRPQIKPKKKSNHLPIPDKDLEQHQKNKLESRIKRMPKLNKPKRIKDPYANRNKPRRSRPTPSQPEIKPDFNVSFAKFLKKNLETKNVKTENSQKKTDNYLDGLGDDPSPRGKSKTSLDDRDNLDTYFDNQRR